MGLGDQLMAAGRARKRHAETGKPIAIGNGQQIIWTPAYLNIPYLLMPGTVPPDAEWIIDYPGHRPYIDYPRTKHLNPNPPFVRGRHRPTRWAWKEGHRPIPAEIILSDAELELKERIHHIHALKPFIIIEPNLKPRASKNKQWPLERYQQVVNLFRKDVYFLQPDLGYGPILQHATPFKDQLRELIVRMSAAKAYLGPEGGLHHLAAATKTPAVVIFGAYITPDTTGYPEHTNLYRDVPQALGQRNTDKYALAAMANITTEEVSDALAKLL